MFRRFAGGTFRFALRAQFTLAGYSHVTQVVAPGEYSVRGGLVDLFPMGSAQPYRLDLFDDEIESIKAFDVDTQRTLYPVPEIRLLPAREFPLDDKGRTRFRQRFREVFEGDPAKSGIYKEDLRPLLDLVDALPNLRLRGLMCIAPNYADVEECRPLFHEMYEIFQQVKEIPFKTANISYLSMGMTHDYQIAVEEGANIVRVGTAIFGPRQY